MIHGTAANDRQNPMPIPHRIRLPLQQQHTHALSPAHPIGGVGERLAPAVRRQPTLPGELHERRRRRHHRHTTGHRKRALTTTQRLRGQMHGHQRRRTGRVDGDGRAFQAEGVRDAAGNDALGAGVAAEALEFGARQQVGVVAVHDAREDAGLAAAQGGRIDSGPFDGFPHRLQQQPLLGVRRQRLARTHSEELGIEAADVVEEAALAGG
ncbi:hypothetical protein GCM10010344_79240 [Streptomyces bluensis]|nr:hypothetical protein GCM10010344_79240 [Streptomyces bluensis]